MDPGVPSAISDRILTGAPVFIVGAPRSGTSILYRTLLKHPRFAVRGDTALQLAESGILDSLHSAPRWKPPRPPRLWLFFLQDEAAYARFLADVHAATSGGEAVAADVKPPWSTEVLQLFVSHAVATRGCARLVEKTPTHIERADWLLDSLPDAKLIFMHRHPLDTYTSYLRRARVDPKATWAELSVEEFAGVYRRHGALATGLSLAVPDRFLTVGYEEFTANPAAVAARICDFVGEEFVSGMVEEPSPDLRRSANDPHLFGEIISQTKRWSDFIDGRTAALVEAKTEEAAAGWGYRPRAIG